MGKLHSYTPGQVSFFNTFQLFMMIFSIRITIWTSSELLKRI